MSQILQEFSKSLEQIPALQHTMCCEQGWSMGANEGNLETRAETITPVAFVEISENGLTFLATFPNPLVSFQQWVFQKLFVTREKKEKIVFTRGKFSNDYTTSLRLRSGEKFRADKGLIFSILGWSSYQLRSEKWWLSTKVFIWAPCKRSCSDPMCFKIPETPHHHLLRH